VVQQIGLGGLFLRLRVEKILELPASACDSLWTSVCSPAVSDCIGHHMRNLLFRGAGEAPTLRRSAAADRWSPNMRLA